MTRFITPFFTTTLLLANSPALTEGPLDYQSRGDRWEGIQDRSVSGSDIELRSALVDYSEPQSGFPANYKVLFYLEKTAQIDLTVREFEPKQFYVMNRVREKETWQPGFNPYQWSTETVLKPLKLTMTQLGVIARVNRTPNRHAESVTPRDFLPLATTGQNYGLSVCV